LGLADPCKVPIPPRCPPAQRAELSQTISAGRGWKQGAAGHWQPRAVPRSGVCSSKDILHHARRQEREPELRSTKQAARKGEMRRDGENLSPEAEHWGLHSDFSPSLPERCQSWHHTMISHPASRAFIPHPSPSWATQELNTTVIIWTARRDGKATSHTLQRPCATTSTSALPQAHLHVLTGTYIRPRALPASAARRRATHSSASPRRLSVYPFILLLLRAYHFLVYYSLGFTSLFNALKN